jgi:hypothetical protein
MKISQLRSWLATRIKASDGAVTVDWVVLTALAITLLAAGYGNISSGTSGLAEGTATTMSTQRN